MHKVLFILSNVAYIYITNCKLFTVFSTDKPQRKRLTPPLIIYQVVSSYYFNSNKLGTDLLIFNKSKKKTTTSYNIEQLEQIYDGGPRWRK